MCVAPEAMATSTTMSSLGSGRNGRLPSSEQLVADTQQKKENGDVLHKLAGSRVWLMAAIDAKKLPPEVVINDKQLPLL